MAVCWREGAEGVVMRSVGEGQCSVVEVHANRKLPVDCAAVGSDQLKGVIEEEKKGVT